MSALLQVEGLRVDIPTPMGMLHAVRGVDLALEAGETLCLVGAPFIAGDPGRAYHGGAGRQFAVDGDPGAGPVEVGPLCRGAQERHAASAQPRLRHRGARHRLPHLAHYRGRGAAERLQQHVLPFEWKMLPEAVSKAAGQILSGSRSIG